MPDIPSSEFTSGLLMLLSETFESVQGIFLDKNTSLFETLAGITAAEASIPVGGQCASIAAQTAHVTFYLEVLEKYMQTGQNERVDWGEIWRTIEAVTPQEWETIQEQLRQTYQRVRSMAETWQDWSSADAIAGAIGLVAHSAYHLGEIRQATCTIRSR
jgi:hypothetical protein